MASPHARLNFASCRRTPQAYAVGDVVHIGRGMQHLNLVKTSSLHAAQESLMNVLHIEQFDNLSRGIGTHTDRATCLSGVRPRQTEARTKTRLELVFLIIRVRSPHDRS